MPACLADGVKAASVPGCTLLGYLSDRLQVRYVIFISCLATALSCLLLWGFGTHSGPLVAFSLLYGLFGLSFAALWAKIISVIASGYLCLLRAVGVDRQRTIQLLSH